VHLLLSLLACAVDPLPLAQQPPPLQLDVSAVLPGQTATFSVAGANAGETVHFVRGSQLGVTCPPQLGGLCLDLAAPLTVLASRRADATGAATWSFPVPPATPAGATLTFQAVVLRAGGGVTSDVERRVIGRTLVATVDDLAPGELLVTEVMKDPTAVSDTVGEWFEVLNRSGRDVDLRGLRVTDLGTDSYTVPSSWVLAAGERAVIGASTQQGSNGGVPVDLGWQGTSLGNGDDEIVLSNAWGALDLVAWDDGVTFPDTPGSSLALSPAHEDATLNNVGASWCVSAPGGTPGLPNPDCWAPVCGDGQIEIDERCDDGNTTAGDGCDAACEIEACLPWQDLRGWFELEPTNAYEFRPVDSAWTTDGDLMLIAAVDSGAGPRSSLSRFDGGALVQLGGDVMSYEDVQLRAVAPTVAWGLSWAAGDVATHGPSGGDVLVWRGARLELGGPWWRYQMAGAAEETVTDIATTSDDGLVVVGGWRETPQADEKGFVLRLNSAGAVVWATSVDRHAGPERVDGVRVRPDGGVVVWSVVNGPARATLLVQTLDANGASSWSGELDVAAPLQLRDATIFGRGDLVLLGESGTRVLYTHLGFEGVRRQGLVLGPVQGDATAGAVARLPMDCADTSIVSGDACLTVGQRCANLQQESCDCDGASWSCSIADGPRVYVQWMAEGAAEPWRVTDMHTASYTTWASDDPALAPLLGGVSSLRDGLAIGLAAGDLGPTVLRFDEQLDPGCGRAATTDRSTAGDAGTWTWRRAAGPAPGSALFSGAVQAAPQFAGLSYISVSVRCAEGACP
jgi:cysteine-rich repeat protein